MSTTISSFLPFSLSSDQLQISFSKTSGVLQEDIDREWSGAVGIAVASPFPKAKIKTRRHLHGKLWLCERAGEVYCSLP